MNRIIFLLAVILLLGACSSDSDESVTISRNGSNQEYLIHLKQVKDSISLNLSDFADDFEFIPLETKEECFLSYVHAYITNNYILVQKHKHGILQFDLNGRFLRTLVKYGKGPQEYINSKWTVDEEEQLLYLSDMGKPSYFLRFDLHTGDYLGDLRKAIPGRDNDIYLYKKDQLMVSCDGSLGTDDNPYQIYWQDLNGKLIDGIKAPPGFFIRNSKIFKISGEEYRYQVYNVDTIFSIKNKQKIPYMIFDFGEPNPESNDYVGHKSMNLYFEANYWVQFYNFYTTKIENRGDGKAITITSGAVANYTLDKKNSKVYNSGDLLFTPTNHSLTSSEYQFIVIQDNGIVYYPYQALDLIEQAEVALANPDFKEPYRTQLEEIIKDLDENDNPVLLFGRLK